MTLPQFNKFASSCNKIKVTLTAYAGLLANGSDP